MDCKKIGILLSAYIDSELSEKDAEVLKKHLQACNQCREKFVRMKKVNRIFFYKEKFDLSPYFETKLLGRIQQNRNGDATARDFITAEKRVILGGFISSLILFIVVYTSSSSSNKTSVYEDIRNYIFENNSNLLAKQMATKSEITTDDIISLFVSGEAGGKSK